MRIRLKTVLISVVVLFVILIFLKVSKVTPKIIKFFRIYYWYILSFIFLLILGVIVYKFLKKQSLGRDMSKVCFDYLNKWWSDDMKQNEVFKFEDARMSEGWYGNEKFYGFNITKKDSNTRFVGIIGTNPVRMVYFDNSPKIKEEDNPFLLFYEKPPNPTQDYQVTPSFNPQYQPRTMKNPKKKKKTIKYNPSDYDFGEGEGDDYEE